MPDRIVSSLLTALIDSGRIEHLASLISQLKTFEQRKYMNSFIVFIAKKYFATDFVSKDDAPISTSKTVSAAAALIYILIKDNDVLKEHLVSSLMRSTIPALDDSLSARRSVLAALAKDEGKHRLSILGYLRLKYHRETAYTSRRHHKAVWRLSLRQAYARSTTRRYEDS